MEWWVWITTGFLFCVRYEDYIEYIIKEHETLTKIPAIYVHIKN